MKLLLDTNVVLDVLLNRDPWVAVSSAIWAACDRGQATAYLPASVLTDIRYVARRAAALAKAHAAVQVCLAAFAICPVDRLTLERAQQLPDNDFEDNFRSRARCWLGLTRL